MRLLLFFLLCSLPALAQPLRPTVIGIKHAPPFVILEGQQPQGLSIDIWELIAGDMDQAYTYRRYESLPALMKAVEEGEVDMSINPISVSASRMESIAFSQPFYISGTAVVREKTNDWWRAVQNIFSWKFLSAVFILIVIILLFGMLVWYFERNKNPDQFSRGWKGLGDGFWWSAVTMTTVGYGDKSPVSAGGRIVGFVWMFTAIIMISGLTAAIASALTVSSMEGNIENVEDLRSYKVGAVAGSSSAAYLHNFDIRPTEYSGAGEALQALKNGDERVVVYDRPILSWYLSSGDFEELQLLKQDLKTDYYSFSFPLNSPLLKSIDPLLVRALNSPTWHHRLEALHKE